MSKLKSAYSESGMSRAGTLFLLAVFGSILFVCAQVFPFYYYYYEFKGLMDAQGRLADEKTDDEIRSNLMKRAEELELPIDDPREIKIKRNQENIEISVNYTEVLWFSLFDKEYDLYEFEFDALSEVSY